MSVLIRVCAETELAATLGVPTAVYVTKDLLQPTTETALVCLVKFGDITDPAQVLKLIFCNLGLRQKLFLI